MSNYFTIKKVSPWHAKALESAGFGVSKTLTGRTRVAIPEGWRLTSSEWHGSELIDTWGHTILWLSPRGSALSRAMFGVNPYTKRFKAVRPVTRYKFDVPYCGIKGIRRGSTEGTVEWKIIDTSVSGGEPVHQGVVQAESPMRGRLLAEAAAESWLDQNKPGWRNPLAYWD